MSMSSNSQTNFPKGREVKPEGWVTMRLGEACTKIGSGATPRGGKESYLESGPYALIRSQNVHNDRFNHEGLVYIDEQQAADLRNVEVFKGDVLLNITGDSVARSCQVVSDILPARVNQHVAILRPAPEILSAQFLRYLLISPHMQAVLQSIAGSGGTRKALTKGVLEGLQICIPKRVEDQVDITRILKRLDDKISLNLKRSETLEKMATTLYQSWFLDFDAVRASEQGRKSLLPAHLASLFLDQLVDSEVGFIPESWSIKPLSTIAELQRKATNPCDFPDASFSHYSIPAYDSGRAPIIQYGHSIRSHKYRLQPGSVLVSRLNPEIERVWLTDAAHDEDAICSTEFLVLVPKHPFTTSYLYCLARSRTFRLRLISLITGTSKSHQRAPVKSVMSMDVLVPPASVIAAFDLSARNMLDRVLQLRREISSLVSLRDRLLPVLVSGDSSTRLGCALT